MKMKMACNKSDIVGSVELFRAGVLVSSVLCEAVYHSVTALADTSTGGRSGGQSGEFQCNARCFVIIPCLVNWRLLVVGETEVTAGFTVVHCFRC